jgi:hypothetical protein
MFMPKFLVYTFCIPVWRLLCNAYLDPSSPSFMFNTGCKDINAEDSAKKKKFKAIISLKCTDESYVEYMLNDVDGGSLMSECLFNDDNMTSDSKIANNTESLSENNQLKTNVGSNHGQAMVSSLSVLTDSQLESQNSQLEPKIQQHSDETVTSPNDDLYLKNFLFVITSVLSEKDDKDLFDANDDTIIKSFQELSDPSKTLYVRLFQRKYKWFQTSNVKYPRISKNLQPCFNELIEAGML